MGLRAIARWSSLGPLTLLAIATVAASSSAGPLTFGLKGGVTLASFRDDPIIFEWSNRTGLTGVAFADYALSGTISIQPEIAYVQRGASAGRSPYTDDQGNPLGLVETIYVRDDLAIGLLARVGPERGTGFVPYFMGGPTLLIELNEQISVSGGGGGSADVDNLRSTDVALGLGAGVEKLVGKGYWLLEMRYEFGLADIAEDSYLSGLHTSTWRVMTGYSF